MAGEQEKDGTGNFIVHETDGRETAAAEGSIGAADAEDALDGEEADGTADDADDNADDNADDVGDEGDDDDDAGDEGDDDGDAGDEDEEVNDKPKKKRSAKGRIGQLTKARRAAERRAAAAEAKTADTEARLHALEKKLTLDDGGDNDDTPGEGNAADDGKPDPEKFTYGEFDAKYQEALFEWRMDKRDAQHEAEQTKTRQEEAEQQHVVEFNTNYENTVTEGATAYDDFEAVVIGGAGDEAKGIAPKYDLTPDFIAMAVTSPVGHHVVYEVACNPVYSRKLAKMTPLKQAQEFGRLAAQHTSQDATPKKKKVTKATPPPKTKLSGSGVVKKSVADMSFAEFEKQAHADKLLM